MQICFVSIFLRNTLETLRKCSEFLAVAFFAQRLLGGDGEGVPNVPIPNTTVRSSSADGTWAERSWESRTPPSNGRALPTIRQCFLLCATHSDYLGGEVRCEGW